MTTTLRIDDGLKADCDLVFENLGINLTSAITMFLKQVVRTQGIPFEVSCAPFAAHDRIVAKLDEARRDVADGHVKPLEESLKHLRSKFNVHA